MVTTLRLQAIHRTVADLAASEDDLAMRLERAHRRSAGYPDVQTAIGRFQPMVQAHRDQLAAYLADSGGSAPSRETAGPQAGSEQSAALSEVLRDLSLAFHHLALGYSMLHEVVARLYEPRLRGIAVEHLKACAGAALSSAQLLPGIVAAQLAQDGLHCACVCPMCGMGACGCVDWANEELVTAWRDAAPVTPEQPGFVLLSPRPESALARAGVLGGDHILAVDGQAVHGRQEVQDALRKRSLGDEVRFLIRHSSDLPREHIIRHAGDYPKS